MQLWLSFYVSPMVLVTLLAYNPQNVLFLVLMCSRCLPLISIYIMFIIEVALHSCRGEYMLTRESLFLPAHYLVSSKSISIPGTCGGWNLIGCKQSCLGNSHEEQSSKQKSHWVEVHDLLAALWCAETLIEPILWGMMLAQIALALKLCFCLTV